MVIEKTIERWTDDGRVDAVERLKQARSFLASKPGCGGCGSPHTSVAWQWRDGTRLTWTARCPACAAKENASRRAAARTTGHAATPAAGPRRAAPPPVAPANPVRVPIYARVAPFWQSADVQGQRTARRVREVLASGCFDRAIRGGQVDCDVDHEWGDWPVASQQSGTLRLWEGSTGLWAEALVEPALAARVARGDFRGCSFSYVPGEFDEYGLIGERPLKTLRVVDLRRISLITRQKCPTYEDTAVYTAAGFKALKRAK